MVIQVLVRQIRYNDPMGMDTLNVSKFITLMEQFGEYVGSGRPKVSTPQDSTSIKFEFEVDGD